MHIRYMGVLDSTSRGGERISSFRGIKYGGLFKAALIQFESDTSILLPMSYEEYQDFLDELYQAMEDSKMVVRIHGVAFLFSDENSFYRTPEGSPEEKTLLRSINDNLNFITNTYCSRYNGRYYRIISQSKGKQEDK